MVCLFALAACGGGNGGAGTAASDGGAKNATSSKSDSKKPQVKVVDSGFAQGQYLTTAMVIVTTDDEEAIGESVTANVNFLDANGQILATADQVESFDWVGQQLAMPVIPSEIPDGAKVAKIETSAALSDYDMGTGPKVPLPVLDSTEIKKGELSDVVASFALTNESDEPMKNPRIGVVCYDAANKIIGGTSTYPNLVPAGGTIRIDADPVTQGMPKSCKAFVGYDVS